MTTLNEKDTVPLAVAVGQEVYMVKLDRKTVDETSSLPPPLTLEKNVVDLAWNHNGQVLAVVCHVANSSSRVSLIEAESGAILEKLLFGGLCRSVAFGSSSRYLCVSSCSNECVLYDLAENREVKRFQTGSKVLKVGFTAGKDGDLLHILCDDGFSTFDLDANVLVCKVPTTSETGQLIAFDTYAAFVALADSEGEIGVFSFIDGDKKQSWKHADSTILRVSFSSVDPVQLAVLSQDRLVVYDWRTGESLNSMSFDPNEACCCMSWNDSFVAIGTDSGSVLLWDWKEGMIAHRMEFGKPVSCLELVPSPEYDASDANLSAQRDSTDALGLAIIRDLVRQEVDRIRTDVREDMTALHVDMMRQFQLQSDDFRRVVENQMEEMRALARDNVALRRENDSLKMEIAQLKEKK